MQTNLTPRTDKAVFRAKVARGEPVTAQEVFDVAVEGVILQGGAAMNGASCAYRAFETGRQCAAGQLIPDSFYCKAMEGNYFGGTACADSATLRDHLGLISSLQSVHDNAAYGAERDDGEFIELFKSRAARLAWQYGLTVPPLAQIEEPSGARIVRIEA